MMNVSFGKLQNTNYIPIYGSDEIPSMCELYYLLKKLYNYEPGLIHIIKQFIFTKSSPLNNEYISIWEIYDFYFNYQLTENEYLKLCNDDTITRFWSEFSTILVIHRNRGTLIPTWNIRYQHINLVFDYCKKYYLNNHNRKIKNYKKLIKLITEDTEIKNKIIQQEHLIKYQELDSEFKDKLITKEEYDKQITELIEKKTHFCDKIIKLNRKECYNKCINIRDKILIIKQQYDILDTHILCLK